MDRKVLTAAFVVGLVATIAGAGLYAYFSDVETSTGNTFTAGSLDLKISDRDEDPRDGVTATWTLSDMKPGDTVGPYSVTLQNLGSITADHLEISCSSAVTDPVGPESDTEEGTTDMDWAMEITSMDYNGYDLLSGLSDLNGNGIKDLDDFEAQGFDNLDPPNGNGGIRSFMMALRFHPTLGDNDYQGDILTTTITFTLNQDSSQ